MRNIGAGPSEINSRGKKEPVGDPGVAVLVQTIAPEVFKADGDVFGDLELFGQLEIFEGVPDNIGCKVGGTLQCVPVEETGVVGV